MKRFLSLLLSCLTLTAFAASMKDLTWKVKKGNATIIACDISAKGDLIIPEYTEDGDRVVAIDKNAFIGATELTSVTLPNSITSIGNNAFKGCTQLTSLTWSNELKSIGKNAFAGCTQLDVNALVMPNNPKLKVGKGAFTQCKVTPATAVPGETLSTQLGTALGYKAATSVSGLKFNKKTGAFTATFKKPGTYEGVYFKAAEKLKVQKINVGDFPKLTIVKTGDNPKCVVKGAGAYLAGKKITLTAKPAKDKIFLGFYEANGTTLITAATKYKHEMGTKDTTLIAKFKTENIQINEETIASAHWEKGAPVNIKVITTTDTGLKSLKAKLPKGLKLKKISNEWFILGTPTVEGHQIATFTIGTYGKQTRVIPVALDISRETMTLDCSEIPAAVQDGVAIGDKEIFTSATSGIKSVKASKLPSGLKLKKVGTRWFISGTPKANKTYTTPVVITATSVQKTVESATLNITVNVDPNKPIPVNLPKWAAGDYVGMVEYEDLAQALFSGYDYEWESGGFSDSDGIAAMILSRNGQVKGYIGFGNGIVAQFNSTVKVLSSSSDKLKLELIVEWYHIDDIVSEELRGKDFEDILDKIDPDGRIKEAIGFSNGDFSSSDIRDIYKAIKNIGKVINKIDPIIEELKQEGKIDLSGGPLRRAKTILSLKGPKHDWLEKVDPVEMFYSDLGDNVDAPADGENLPTCRITGDLTKQ